jgi:hypothetical protein
MPIDFNRSELTSVQVRKDIVSSGIRLIASNKDEKGDLIKSFLGGLLKIGGWIIGKIFQGLSFTFSGLFALIRGTASFIYNFNWNATDEGLDTQLQQLTNLVGGQLGGTFGNLLGFLVCGIAPAAGVAYFNEPVGLYLLKEIGEEAFDEFLANLGMLVQTSASLLLRWTVINMFKSNRRIIKGFFRNPNSKQSQFASMILGEGFTNAIARWGEPGSKPWSFRRAVEEAIDNIENPFLQAFTEEFYEEFLDGCGEAFYIIGQGLDSWVLQQKLAQNDIFGQERAVEITFDRENPEEKLVLVGSEKLIKQNLVQTMTHHAMIRDRDMGFFMGETVRENMVKTVSTVPLTLVIIWKNKPSPPYGGTTKCSTVKLTIPDINRAKLDWQQIKQLAGGTNGFLTGPEYVYGEWENGIPFFHYGSSSADAQSRIERLATLSNIEILDYKYGQQVNKARTQKYNLKRTVTQLFPAWMTILNQQKMLNEESGRTTKSGTYKSRKYKIDLYLQEKPNDFEEIINDLIYTPGINS